MNENKKKLMKQFFRMNIMMHRYQSYLFKMYGPFGNPHRGQGRILSLLKMKPEISQKELSYLLDMRSQSLGELLAKLERNGLITRTPSEADRRVMDIKLTEEGEKAAGQSEQHQFEEINFFDCLTDDEQIKLGEYLDKIINELKKRLGEDDIFEHDFGAPWLERGHRPPPFAREMFEKFYGSCEGRFDDDAEEPGGKEE